MYTYIACVWKGRENVVALANLLKCVSLPQKIWNFGLCDVIWSGETFACLFLRRKNHTENESAVIWYMQGLYFTPFLYQLVI